MKRATAILSVLLILLSGMHLALSQHYCHGHLVGAKLTQSRQFVSCGMEADVSTCEMNSEMTSFADKNDQLTQSCCKNKITEFVVDHNYSPSAFSFEPYDCNIALFYVLPFNVGVPKLAAILSNNANYQPPGPYGFKAVILSDICVFRI